jgi:RimJ/RimL family protein N-acetyltransferase
MAEKAGMRLEGEFVEDRYVKGAWVSTSWYGLLKRDYTQRGCGSRPKA